MRYNEAINFLNREKLCIFKNIAYIFSFNA